MDRQQRNAIVTITISIVLFVLLVGLAPSGQSTPTGSDTAFTWLRPIHAAAGSTVVGAGHTGQSRTREVRVVTLTGPRSPSVEP
jgi:hypothetical protein